MSDPSSNTTSNPKLLLWRQDPQKSYSDWTIEIIRSDTGDSDTYYVHKVFLAAGPIGSSYFEGVFRSNMSETQTNTSSIEFPKSAADAFPAFLDYLYSGNIVIKPESVIALHYLGNYFGVLEAMRPKLSVFLKSDVNKSSSHVATYCHEAVMYEQVKIVAYLIKMVPALYANELLAESCDDNDGTPAQRMMKALTDKQQKQVYLNALKQSHTAKAKVESNLKEAKAELSEYKNQFGDFHQQSQPPQFVPPSTMWGRSSDVSNARGRSFWLVCLTIIPTVGTVRIVVVVYYQ